VNPSERKLKNPLKRHTLNHKNEKKFQQVHVRERERERERERGRSSEPKDSQFPGREEKT
jgi:hypothetical protein